LSSYFPIAPCCRCTEAPNGSAPLSLTCRIRGTQTIILTEHLKEAKASLDVLEREVK
jgi:hypothetical protein